MICRDCLEDKPECVFVTRRTPEGRLRRRGVCVDCRDKYAQDNFERLQEWRRNYNANNRDKKRARDIARRAEIKAFVDEYKNKPCADCGVKWPPVAMDLDHVRGNKVMGVASMVASAYRIELVKLELEKCEVVCACCHRLRTAARGEHRAPNQYQRLHSAGPDASCQPRAA